VTPPGGTRETGISFRVAFFVTPETSASTHYFWVVTRDFNRNDPEADKAIMASAGTLLENEDGPIVRNIQQALGNKDFFAERPVLLPADEALVRLRRKWSAFIADEEAQVHDREVEPVI
jgi:phenylpropionate dioxygenase-like ring-hydroxylating dioxygenase large terminal subunit